MADEPALLKVTFDGSYLAWLEKYVAIFPLFYYWNGPDRFFSADAILHPHQTKNSVSSQKIFRPLEAPYVYFFLYLFLKPDANIVQFLLAVVADIKKLKLQDPSAKRSQLKQLEETLCNSPIDYYIGPFMTSCSNTVVVPPALAVAKLELAFLPDATINGMYVKAKSAKVRMSFLNNSNQIISRFKEFVKIPGFGAEHVYRFTSDHTRERVDIYRDDRNFFLEVQISYELEEHEDGPSEEVPTEVIQKKLKVSPLVPCIYLKPDLKLFTLSYDGSLIAWDEKNPVLLVLVVASLHDMSPVAADHEPFLIAKDSSFPTVTMDHDGPMEILRTTTVPASDTIAFEWTAYYYFAKGPSSAISNPNGKPVQGDRLVLPPSPHIKESGEWADFECLDTQPHYLKAVR